MGSLTNWGAARPSFLSGLASIPDFGNTLSEYGTIPAEIYDAFQLALDWRVIGDDMRKVLAGRVKEVERINGRAAAGAI